MNTDIIYCICSIEAIVMSQNWYIVVDREWKYTSHCSHYYLLLPPTDVPNTADNLLPKSTSHKCLSESNSSPGESRPLTPSDSRNSHLRFSTTNLTNLQFDFFFAPRPAFHRASLDPPYIQLLHSQTHETQGSRLPKARTKKNSIKISSARHFTMQHP
jgi:hypothetical protein